MKYDLIVVGGGPGGYVAAIKAAKEGLSVALIEKDKLGGTCLNRGCIPAKAMIHASEVYHQSLEGERFGVHASSVSFDYDKILEYKQETIDGLVGGVAQLLKANGIEVYEGRGTLLEPSGRSNRVRVSDCVCEGCACDDNSQGECILESDSVILASGSQPAQLPVPGMDLPGVLDSDGLLALDHAPESIVIIGGGVIGVEFATAYSNLGTRVTIIEALPRILDNFDKEISQNLKMILKKKGVDMHTDALVKEITEAGETGVSSDKLTCSFEEKDKEMSVSGQYVLCAAGRVPVTEDLFDEGIASMMEFEGKFVKVDDCFRTSMPGVYAIGDLTGGIQLAHAASAHGIRAVEHICESAHKTDQNLNVIPGCVYTDPEIASVGDTEAQASEQGKKVSVGKFIMSANGKSLVTREERGFIKVVADSESGAILGAQMMCARATDMIGEFTTAIVSGLTVADMLKGIRAHPTYNEGIGEALEDVFGESIHTAPRRRK